MRTHATTKVEISEEITKVAKCPFKSLIATLTLITIYLQCWGKLLI